MLQSVRRLLSPTFCQTLQGPWARRVRFQVNYPRRGAGCPPPAQKQFRQAPPVYLFPPFPAPQARPALQTSSIIAPDYVFGKQKSKILSPESVLQRINKFFKNEAVSAPLNYIFIIPPQWNYYAKQVFPIDVPPGRAIPPVFLHCKLHNLQAGLPGPGADALPLVGGPPVPSGQRAE